MTRYINDINYFFLLFHRRRRAVVGNRGREECPLRDAAGAASSPAAFGPAAAVLRGTADGRENSPVRGASGIRGGGDTPMGRGGRTLVARGPLRILGTLRLPKSFGTSSTARSGGSLGALRRAKASRNSARIFLQWRKRARQPICEPRGS
jgi:hypothetical protein